MVIPTGSVIQGEEEIERLTAGKSSVDSGKMSATVEKGNGCPGWVRVRPEELTQV